MGWKDEFFRSPFLFSSSADQHPLRPFKKNERCFIRKNHKCGKIYGASKSCFVACPSEDEIEPILELITEKLAKVGIEAIIAVKERAYGQDIFCTKICGKIIESKFCLVMLDDLIEEKKNIPNPNVYYEYGLMTSLEKHIIPLQKQNLKLAFNIQSYDTIKYTSKNIAAELDRAIKDAIKITESKEKPDEKYSLVERSILRNFEVAGLELKGKNWFLSDVIDDTQFKGFGQHNKKFYVYLGKIDEENEIPSYIEDINVTMFRTEKEYKKQKKRLNNLRKELKENAIETFEKSNIKEKIRDLKSKIELMSTIYFGFIISPTVNRKDFGERAEDFVSKNDRFKLVYNRNSEITFEDLKVNLLFDPTSYDLKKTSS